MFFWGAQCNYWKLLSASVLFRRKKKHVESTVINNWPTVLIIQLISPSTSPTHSHCSICIQLFTLLHVSHVTHLKTAGAKPKWFPVGADGFESASVHDERDRRRAVMLRDDSAEKALLN